MSSTAAESSEVVEAHAVLIGLGVSGASAAVSVTRRAGVVLNPDRALVRRLWTARSMSPVRVRTQGMLERLNDAGKRHLDQARGRLIDATVVYLDWVLDGVLGSPQAGHVVKRMIDSEEFWELVEQVVYSDQLLEVLARSSHIGAGLAGEVAQGARQRRTERANSAAERIRRRLRPRRNDNRSTEPGPGQADG